MQDLKYVCPKTTEEALLLLKEQGGSAKLLAGGTDLLVQLREHSVRLKGVDTLIDLQKLEELKGITEAGDRIRIGALETHTALAESALLRKYACVLSEAAASVGSPQIRNRGTVGGNVVNASAAADTVSALSVLNAEAEILSSEGRYRVPLASLYRSEGGSALKNDELLVAFEVDKLPGYGQAFSKLARRKALAISRLNVSAALAVSGDRITDARIAPGCVFAVPARVREAEEILKKAPVSEELFREAAGEVTNAMIRISGIRWSTEYKAPALTATVLYALQTAFAGVEGSKNA